MGKISEYERGRLASSVITPTKDTSGEQLQGLAREIGGVADALARNEAEAKQREAAAAAAAKAVAEERRKQAEADADAKAMQWEAENVGRTRNAVDKEYITKDDGASEAMVKALSELQTKAAGTIEDPVVRDEFIKNTRKRIDSEAQRAADRQFNIAAARRDRDAENALNTAAYMTTTGGASDLMGNFSRLFESAGKHAAASSDGGVKVQNRMEQLLPQMLDSFMFDKDKEAVSRAKVLMQKAFKDQFMATVPADQPWLTAEAEKAYNQAYKRATELISNKDFVQATEAVHTVDQQRDEVAARNALVSVASRYVKRPEGISDEAWAEQLDGMDDRELLQSLPENVANQFVPMMSLSLQYQNKSQANIDRNAQYYRAMLADLRLPRPKGPSNPKAVESLNAEFAAIEADVGYITAKLSKDGKPATAENIKHALLAVGGDKAVAARHQRVQKYYESIAKYAATGQLNTKDYMAFQAKMDGMLRASAKDWFDKGTTPLGKALLKSPEDPLQFKLIQKVASDSVRKLDIPDVMKKDYAARITHELVTYMLDRNAYTRSEGIEDFNPVGKWAEHVTKYLPPWYRSMVSASAGAAAQVVNPLAPVAGAALAADGSFAASIPDKLGISAAAKKSRAEYNELSKVADAVVGVGILLDKSKHTSFKFDEGWTVDSSGHVYAVIDQKPAYLKHGSGGTGLTRDRSKAVTMPPSAFAAVKQFVTGEEDDSYAGEE